MSDETVDDNKETCGYCSGAGEYTTESWGIKEKHVCRFCSGSGKLTKSKDKG